MSSSTAGTLTADLGTPRARLISGDLGPVDAADLVAVTDSVAARASALDRADADLREDIAALAELGLFDIDRTPVSVAATIIEAVATESLAVAFGAWAQRMTATYLRYAADRSETALQTYRAVADGRRPGVTGMAAAQRQVVGLGDVPITATPVERGYRIDCPIAWASNVYPNSTIVLAANTADERSLVLTFEASSPGVEIRSAPDLLALNATASTMIGLDGVCPARATCRSRPRRSRWPWPARCLIRPVGPTGHGSTSTRIRSRVSPRSWSVRCDRRWSTARPGSSTGSTRPSSTGSWSTTASSARRSNDTGDPQPSDYRPRSPDRNG